MSLSRRKFLTASAVLGAGLPAVFRRAALAAPGLGEPGARDTVLVVVQLSGGNDGLNTVIPHRHPAYVAARPTLRIPSDQVLTIDRDLGLHPELQGFAKLLEAGQLAIVQGVGYPNPNRSHFESMDIWHKATASAQQRYGWLARAAERLPESGALHAADASPPLALFGATGYAPSLKSLEDYRLQTPGDDPQVRRTIEQFADAQPGDDDLLSFVRASARATYESAERLRSAAASYETPVKYPDSPLAGRLRLFAQLIDAGVPERVFYTSLDGFDTHAAQVIGHGPLLRTLGDALAAFHDDLSHHGHQDRVVSLVFSEFGRRVKENGSQGTDHGAAAPLFLAGGKVKSGPLGDHPGFDALDDGDLRFQLDFRCVYAALLADWLGVSAKEVLDGDFAPAAVFA